MNGQLASEGQEAELGPTHAPEDTPLAVGTRRPEIDLLARVPLFAGLSLTHRRRVAALTEDVTYNPGRVIVRKDDPGRALYVIVDGRAKVVKGRS
jgi:hypothetical protein